MKRLTLVIVLAIVSLFASSSAAQANYSSDYSPQYQLDGGQWDRMTLFIEWNEQRDGQGVWITNSSLFPKDGANFQYDGLAIDWMRYYNGNGTVIEGWGESEAPFGLPYKDYEKDVSINTNCATVKARIWPRVNNQPDPGWMLVSKTVCD